MDNIKGDHIDAKYLLKHYQLFEATYKNTTKNNLAANPEML